MIRVSKSLQDSGTYLLKLALLFLLWYIGVLMKWCWGLKIWLISLLSKFWTSIQIALALEIFSLLSSSLMHLSLAIVEKFCYHDFFFFLFACFFLGFTLYVSKWPLRMRKSWISSCVQTALMKIWKDRCTTSLYLLPRQR